MAVSHVVHCTRLAELEAEEERWAALWSRVPEATPFQHPAWLLPWTRVFAPERLHVFFASAGDELSAVLPLFPWIDAGRPRLSLLGAGISDYLDPLLEGDVRQLWPLLQHALGAADLQLERCELTDLSPRCALLGLGELAPQLDQVGVCPTLRLPKEHAEYLSCLPTWLRRNVKQGLSRATRQGTVRFRRATPEDVTELVEVLIQLHTLEWQARGQSGVLADARVCGFHRQAAPPLLRADLVRLEVMELDGRAIAALYGLQGHGRAYQYIGGFHPEYSRWNLGSVMIARAIEDAMGRGYVEYDFLRGAEPYKYAWGARDAPLQRLSWMSALAGDDGARP